MTELIVDHQCTSIFLVIGETKRKFEIIGLVGCGPLTYTDVFHLASNGEERKACIK